MHASLRLLCVPCLCVTQLANDNGGALRKSASKLLQWQGKSRSDSKERASSYVLWLDAARSIDSALSTTCMCLTTLIACFRHRIA
jgi:hypothetical protein